MHTPGWTHQHTTLYICGIPFHHGNGRLCTEDQFFSPIFCWAGGGIYGHAHHMVNAVKYNRHKNNGQTQGTVFIELKFQQHVYMLAQRYHGATCGTRTLKVEQPHSDLSCHGNAIDRGRNGVHIYNCLDYESLVRAQRNRDADAEAINQATDAHMGTNIYG